MPKREMTAKDWVDLGFTLFIVGVSLYPLYRDDLKRAWMWVNLRLEQQKRYEAEAMKQVQKEISLMEHGEFGEVPDAD